MPCQFIIIEWWTVLCDFPLNHFVLFVQTNVCNVDGWVEGIEQMRETTVHGFQCLHYIKLPVKQEQDISLMLSPASHVISSLPLQQKNYVRVCMNEHLFSPQLWIYPTRLLLL